MKQIEVVAAVIRNQKGEIYVVQRSENSKQYLSKKWEFPGGKIEMNETEVDALIREINEELSVEIEPTEKIITVQHIYPDFHIKMHAYDCQITNGKPILSEHINEKWLLIEELKCVDWAEADVPIVEYLMKKS